MAEKNADFLLFNQVRSKWFRLLQIPAEVAGILLERRHPDSLYRFPDCGVYVLRDGNFLSETWALKLAQGETNPKVSGAIAVYREGFEWFLVEMA